MLLRASGRSPTVHCGHLQEEAQAPDSDFKPNLVNTVCYVIQFIIQLTTFAVNYQGHPFNSSITETKGFFNMLKWSYVFIAIVIYDLFGLGKAFSLVSSSLPASWAFLVINALLPLGRALLVVTGESLTCLGPHFYGAEPWW